MVYTACYYSVLECGACDLKFVQVRSVYEHSGMGGQSFEVFHDSMKGQSHNASYGRGDRSQPVGRQNHAERK